MQRRRSLAQLVWLATPLACGSTAQATSSIGQGQGVQGEGKAQAQRQRGGRVRRATASEVQQWLARNPRKLLSFLGYSGAGYQHTAAMLAAAAGELARHDPARTIVNIGATAEGIGAVYGLARERGFATMGIVSSQVLASRSAWSPDVEQVFVIEDATWGGVDAAGRLSPTSAAIVALSDEMVAIGGGAIARDELQAGRRTGKPTRFIPAESNHELARQKARAAGRPEPTEFSGALGTQGWSSP